MDARAGLLLVVDYLAVSMLAVGFTLWLTPPDSPRRWVVWAVVVLVPVAVAAVRHLQRSPGTS